MYRGLSKAVPCLAAAEGMGRAPETAVDLEALCLLDLQLIPKASLAA